MHCLSPAYGKSLDPAFPSAFLVNDLWHRCSCAFRGSDEFTFVLFFLLQKNMSTILPRPELYRSDMKLYFENILNIYDYKQLV